MLSDFKVFASFSVNGVEEAKRFYSDLGLKILEEFDGGFAMGTSGDAKIMVYEKRSDHQPATYTVLNFEVTDLESIVKSMNEKGIQMEQYPQMNTNEMGISEGEGTRMAWFKDPSGNIISLMQLT